MPRDQFLKPYGGLCYWFVTFRERSYSDANYDCRGHGGTLVLVKSQAINDYLTDQLLIELSFAGKVWIGLNDRLSEGRFEWEDGTPVDYANWAPGHGPLGNSTYPEDCVTLMPNQKGQWDDDVCEDAFFGLVHHRFPYVCQFRTRTSTTCPPFTCDVDCGLEGYLTDPDSGCSICQCGSD